MEWLNWLFEQARTASPFVAVFCLLAVVVMWRQHRRDQDDIRELNRAFLRAMTATAAAQGKVARNLATLAANVRNQRR
jgi:hypothetical protein